MLSNSLSQAYKISGIFLNSALTLIAVTASVNLIASFPIGFSIFIGGVTGILNLYYLLWTVKRSMAVSRDKIVSYVAMRYWFKFLFTAALITVLVSRHIIEPVPFIAGFTFAVFNIIFLIFLRKREVF